MKIHYNKKIRIFLLLLLVLFISSCDQEYDVKNITAEEIEEYIKCGDDYIRHEIACCLDRNSNSICDAHEGENLDDIENPLYRIQIGINQEDLDRYKVRRAGENDGDSNNDQDDSSDSGSDDSSSNDGDSNSDDSSGSDDSSSGSSGSDDSSDSGDSTNEDSNDQDSGSSNNGGGSDSDNNNEDSSSNDQDSGGSSSGGSNDDSNDNSDSSNDPPEDPNPDGLLFQRDVTSYCSYLKRGSKVPQGYGLPFDEDTDELLFRVDTCSSDSIKIQLGKEKSGLIIYKKGYIYRDNGWESITFTGQQSQDYGAWIKDQARVTITDFNVSGINYIVGHVCRWDGERWKCGCENRSCPRRLWNLQIVDK